MSNRLNYSREKERRRKLRDNRPQLFRAQTGGAAAVEWLGQHASGGHGR